MLGWWLAVPPHAWVGGSPLGPPPLPDGSSVTSGKGQVVIKGEKHSKKEKDAGSMNPRCFAAWTLFALPHPFSTCHSCTKGQNPPRRGWDWTRTPPPSLGGTWGWAGGGAGSPNLG